MKILTQTNTWGQKREDETVRILKKKFGDENVIPVGKLGSKEDMIGGIDCEIIVDGVKLTSQVKPFTYIKNNKEVLVFSNKNTKIIGGQYVFPESDLIYDLN
jgi:hypothetical protein